MNVAELASFLEQAMIAGLDPDTTVVIANPKPDFDAEIDDDWLSVESIENPALDFSFCWLTIYTGQPVDYESPAHDHEHEHEHELTADPEFAWVERPI